MDDYVKHKMPKKKHPKVPGFDAHIIRPLSLEHPEEFAEDVKRVRRMFWRWVREEYGLGHAVGAVDEGRPFTDDEEEAFVGLFMPQYNAGRLTERYYHDGRRFYVKNIPYTQIWDESLLSFYWVPESGPNAGAGQGDVGHSSTAARS